MEDVAQRPIRLVVRDDDLERSRLTVFFRLILAIPLFIWVTLRGIAAFVVAIVNWLAVLVQRRSRRARTTSWRASFATRRR